MHSKPFYRHSRLKSPQKIVQAQLRRRLSKASSELGFHYFLWHVAHDLRYTNIFDLMHYLLSKSQYNIERESIPKRHFVLAAKDWNNIVDFL